MSDPPPRAAGGRTTRSVRTEIVAGFATLVLALAVVGGYALARQARAVEALRLQNEGYLPLSLALGEAHAAQTIMDTLLERFVEERDRAASRAWMRGARRTRRGVVLRARALASSARSSARAREDHAILARADATLARVERAYRDDEAAFTALFDALGAGDAARSREVHRGLMTRELSAEDELRALVRAVAHRMAALAAEAEDAQRRTLRVLTLATLVALAVGMLTLVSARRALRPLALLIQRVRAVAGGDLTPRVVPARPDEIGELAREFDNMVEAVKARDTALRDRAAAIRRAEQHLEQVVATLRAAVMVVGPGGTVESANPAARRLADGAALEGEAFATTPFGAVAEIAAAVRATLEAPSRARGERGGGTGEPAGATLLAVAVGERVLDVSVTTFASPGGDPGALVVADDVTEREQARARVLQNERLAAIGRMAAHVTHEVRNPLSSMALNAEMLADEARELGPDAREVERLVGAIQREIDRLTSITEEYLRVARLPRPRLEREDVAAVVEEAVGFVAAELGRAGIEVTVRVDEGVPATLLDEQQLRQALLNLLRNAREAVESAGASGKRAIRVAVARSRGGVEVTVSDSGPGIPADARGRLFELFFTTKERGSGLGLPLTREIVLAHGGTIDVGTAAPEEGGGARFAIWLPAAPRRASEADAAAGAGASGGGGAAQG